MNAFQRGLGMFFILCLTGSVACGLAETKTWDVEDSSIYFQRRTTFTQELPQVLAKALAGNGFQGYACYGGAMNETILKEEERAKAEANARQAEEKARAKGVDLTIDLAGGAQALVALEKDGRRMLVGLARHGDDPWQVETLGEKALLPQREFRVELRELASPSTILPSSGFCVTYPQGQGGAVAYGFEKRDGPWFVAGYQETDAQGRGLAIVNGALGCGFRFHKLPMVPEDLGEMFYAYLPLHVAYMKHITEFPTTREQAQNMAQESWKRFDGTDLAIVSGVNLREKPTTGSPSQGAFTTGPLVHVLGQKEGKDAPWYQVRVGGLQGWVSGVYVKFPGNWEFGQYLSVPLRVARATEARSLKASPAQGAQTVMELPKDSLMHVILTREDGWLYVMVPRGELTWELDVDGTGGFVQAEGVAQGFTVEETWRP